MPHYSFTGIYVLVNTHTFVITFKQEVHLRSVTANIFNNRCFNRTTEKIQRGVSRSHETSQ